MPITSGGKVVLIAPNGGGIVLADPEAAQQQIAAGYQPATADDVKNHNRQTQYGTVAQQSLAQAERVVRGATLGQVEGIGSDEAIRERAELSQEEHPYVSFAADLAPDVALGFATGGGSALATTAGRAAAKAAGRAALKEGATLGAKAALGAASRAAPVAALAGEAIAGGAVAASQQAFQEGRQFFHENPVEDATNALLWAGIGGVLGGAPAAFKAVKGRMGKAGKVAAELADEGELNAAFKSGEEAVVPLPDAAGESTPGVPHTTDQGTLEAAEKAAGAKRDPLDNIQLRDADDERLSSVSPEVDRLRQEGTADKTLDDPNALPVDAAYGGSAQKSAPIPESQVAAAAERGVNKAERNAVRSQAEEIVNKVAKGESPLKESGGFLRDSRLAQYQPEIIETATQEMRKDLNELNRLSQGIRERAVKQEDVARNISDNLPAQQTKARDIALAGQRLAGEIRADAHALAASMGKNRPQYFSGTARDLVSSLRERTMAISKMKDGAEIFNALDDLKRQVDTAKVALESGSRKSAKDPMSYQALIPKVEEFAHSIRASLEDASTFGRAGEMQKAYNATYHQKWFPAKRVFEDSVFKVTGRDYRAFDTLDAWESKITNLLQNSGGGERRHVGDMLGALKEMAEQRAKYGTASKKETARITELVDKINRTFELGDETMAASRRMKDATQAATVGASGLAGVIGGLPGAIIGGAFGKGASELATGKYRRAFLAMRGATDDAVGRSVDEWIASSKVRGAGGGARSETRALLPSMSDDDRQLLKTATRLGATLGFAAFLGENDDPQAAYTSKRDALLDDEGFATRFGDEFGDLATEEPSVYMVAAGKAAEVRKFLLDRLPANIAVSMSRPKGYPPTNEAIEDWSVYWNAATNPRSVVGSLARGDVRPQEVETLRTLYRPLYEKMQSSLLDKISNASEMGDDLDDQFVMRMSLLFDLDGAGTPAFSQRAANVARQVTPEQQPQPSKPFAPKSGARVSPANVAITGPTYGSMG